MVIVVSKHSGRKYTCHAENRHRFEGATLPCQDCKPVKRWAGSKPTTCQLCNRELSQQFVDGKTLMGPWAIMCAVCHHRLGVGLGVGRGQRYDLNTLEKVDG